MDKREIIEHLMERGDPLSIWAAETIRRLRRANGKLAKRADDKELSKKIKKADHARDSYESMWRSNNRRVSSLLDMWRPLANEIIRIKGLGNRLHSVNDINEGYGGNKLGNGSIYIKEFIADRGIRVTDLREEIMKILSQTKA